MKRRKDKVDAPSGFSESDLEPASRPRLTPDEVQTKEFRLSFRGYHEGDVDEFLDQVTEDLAALHEENKRLREQAGDPHGGPVDLQAAEERAERIVREAREHAARLVADAERRVAHLTEASGEADATPGWYLLQERDFLERLASLVKDHAEDLKRRARSRPEEPADLAEASSPAPVAKPAPEDVLVVEESAADEPEEDWQKDESNPGGDRIDLTPLEATAPMNSVTAGEEHDLLRDWDERIPEEEPNRRKDESASLKELFWGEES
ncbi:MAG TPA: DivIVA domain-containing protein [Actinomycetota bacterium]|jgi:DivIVA domain-containing protein|nr:DivIVA domain-containing protein [Actinomycetota bacterium]